MAKCDAFAQIPELREPVLLHEGHFKWFHEEIYPRSLFASPRWGARHDMLCVPKRDPSRDVDAEVRESSGTIHLEITDAREQSEHLRMEYLVKDRRVSLTGELKVGGTRRTGRRIENVLDFEDHRVSRDRHLSWIKIAAEGKAGQCRPRRSRNERGRRPPLAPPASASTARARNAARALERGGAVRGQG